MHKDKRKDRTYAFLINKKGLFVKGSTFMRMKKILRSFLYIFIVVILVSGTFCISNGTVSAAKEKTTKRVYDYAKVFSEKEEQKLEKLAKKYYGETGYNYLVVTTKSRSEHKYEKTDDLDENCNLYTDSFYRDFVSEYGEDNKDCMILMLDLSKNRYAVVSGQGELEYLVEDDSCDDIFQDIKEYLSEDDYFTAATAFMETIEYYIDVVEEEDYDSEDWDDSDDTYDSDDFEESGMSDEQIEMLVYLCVPFAVSSIILYLVISLSGGRMTVNRSTYLDSVRSRVVAREDRYLRTRTQRRRVEDHSHSTSHHSSSGGSSSSSGGGGSHGGGHF